MIQRKAESTRRMFAAIAPRYDLLNHLLSVNRDKAWRRRACRMLDLSGGERVLDVCAGTGDFAIALLDLAPDVRQVSLCDFAEPMLALAREKANGLSSDRLGFVCGDALALPYADAAFDVVTCAFGARNFESLEPGLRELRRVTRPGGQLLLLEFCRSRGATRRAAADLFITKVVPRVGALVSGDRAAYEYLPRSIGAFVSRDEMVGALESAGYEDVRSEELTWGIASIFHATRKP